MSEAVRRMTREELFSECAKLERECLALSDKCKAKECQIKEMQSYIDCLTAKLAEIQMNKPELPEEPIKVAEMLISATYTVKKRDVGKAICRAFGNYSDESTYDVYSKSDLRQIAEHLLVYCNHAEVE